MSGLFTAIARAPWLLMFTVTATALCLAGCSNKSMPPLRVTLPPLPATIEQPCDLPAPLADGEVPTLITALMDSWEAQAECELKRAAAVKAYEAARTINNGDTK